nr:hypothetical protein [Enterovibrio nigricans]
MVLQPPLVSVPRIQNTQLLEHHLPDSQLDEYIEDMFRESVGTPEFDVVSEKIMRHVYNSGYMLFVPTPNKVLAVNKNVSYSPYRMANMPLWEIEVSPDHWSVK